MAELVNYTTMPCVICRKREVIALEADKIARWKAGAFVQDVWPEMPADQRELLISGTHPLCWDRMWPEEE